MDATCTYFIVLCNGHSWLVNIRQRVLSISCACRVDAVHDLLFSFTYLSAFVPAKKSQVGQNKMSK